MGADYQEGGRDGAVAGETEAARLEFERQSEGK